LMARLRVSGIFHWTCVDGWMKKDSAVMLMRK
jgi:hypothetical protein